MWTPAYPDRHRRFPSTGWARRHLAEPAFRCWRAAARARCQCAAAHKSQPWPQIRRPSSWIAPAPAIGPRARRPSPASEGPWSRVPVTRRNTRSLLDLVALAAAVFPGARALQPGKLNRSAPDILAAPRAPAESFQCEHQSAPPQTLCVGKSSPRSRQRPQALPTVSLGKCLARLASPAGPCATRHRSRR